MKIETTQQYTPEGFRELTKASSFNGRPGRTLALTIFATAICILGLILDKLAGETDSLTTILLIIVVFADAFLLWTWLGAPRLAYKKYVKNGSTVNEYCFEDESMTVRSQGGKITGETTLLYTTLYKIVESRKYFILFLNRGQAFVVNKESISEDDATALRTKLYHLFGKKKYRFMK